VHKNPHKKIGEFFSKEVSALVHLVSFRGQAKKRKPKLQNFSFFIAI
jgi:hypothetical protein